MTDEHKTSLFHPITPAFRSPIPLAILGATILLGAFLRLYKLGYQSLWLDEACSWWTSNYDSLYAVCMSDIGWHMHPPGYHLLLHFTQIALGNSEWALRAPSALGGIVSVPLCALLGTRLFGRNIGLLFAALFAVALFPIYQAQDARPYGTLVPIVLWATIAWTYVYERLRDTGKLPWPWAVQLILASALAAYWHYFGLFFIALQGIVLIGLTLTRPKACAQAIAVYVATALLYAPWLPAFWTQLHNTTVGHPTPQAFITTAYWQYLVDVFAFGGVGTLSGNVSAAIGATLAVIGFAAHLRTVAKSAEAGAMRNAVLWAAVLVLWLFGPFLFAYLKSINGPSVYTHKNLIVTLPILYMLAARGVMALPIPRNAQYGIAAVIVFLVLLRPFTAVPYYTTLHKEQFREAVGVMQQSEAATAETPILISGWSTFPYDYYFMRDGVNRRIALRARTEGDIPAFQKWLAETNPTQFWYVASDPQPDVAFSQALLEKYAAVGKWSGQRVNVVLLNRRPAP